MYETFYGLHERPFDLTTNPRFLFLTPRHREALSTLRYGLSAPRGLTVAPRRRRHRQDDRAARRAERGAPAGEP